MITATIIIIMIIMAMLTIDRVWNCVCVVNWRLLACSSAKFLFCADMRQVRDAPAVRGVL